MWVKLLGGGCLFGVVSVWRCCQERMMRQSLVRLDRWIRCLRYVRGQIACFGTPLEEILSHVDAAILPDVRLLQGMSLQQGCADHARMLPGQSGEILRSLGGELGTMFREEQLVRLDYYLDLLEREQIVCIQKGRETGRLHTALSLCGVIGVLLLLW